MRSKLWQRLRNCWSIGALGGLLIAMYTALAVRGFNFGLVADVLTYIYRYETLGTRGGMNWLVVEHWHRHLAGALVSAPLHVLFPPDDDVWFAVAFFLHFLNAFVFFLFLLDWQRGRGQYLVFAVGLVFALDTLDVIYQFIYGTSSHQKIALTFALLSLWGYMRYVRNGRQQLTLYTVSLFCFAVGGAIYEQSLFFFLLHPFLAVLEEWRKPISQPRTRYAMRLLNDILPYGVFVLAYVYLLDVLFLSSMSNASLGHVLRQFVDAFLIAFSPLEVGARVLPSWQGAWALLSGGMALLVGVIVWFARRRAPHIPDVRPLLLFGVGLAVLNVGNVAPTNFNIGFDSRLIYAMSLGNSLIFVAVLDWLTRRIPARGVGSSVFAAGIALFVASGATHFFQTQTEFIRQDNAREAARTAIYEALPHWDEETPPYLLVLTDKHANDELALFARNYDFPFIFDLMYNTEGILADAVFYDVTEPPQSSGKHIIATREGIISPLRPDLRIDPARMIVIAYNSETQTATVLDEVPPDALPGSNLVAEVPFDWETNRAYLD